MLLQCFMEKNCENYELFHSGRQHHNLSVKKPCIILNIVDLCDIFVYISQYSTLKQVLQATTMGGAL